MKNDLRNNIRFNYLYRDGGNYKNYGFVVFANPNKLALDNIKKAIQSNLIDGTFFSHEQLEISSLFFDDYNEDDHFWHELQSLEMTDEAPTDKRSIEEFVSKFHVSKYFNIKVI